jgi:glycosyltransferase involved in cell wall biosynthesis
MIEGKTILCFASGYDAPPTSKHHVMHLLAERNRVLWVNYHGSRAPSVSSSDAAYIVTKLKQVFRGLVQVRENLWVLTPLVVPLPGSRLVKRLNRALLSWQIRSALRRIRSGPLQVWSFTPDIAYLLDTFSPEKVLYYCVDDFASFSGYDREQVLRDEAALCDRADVVVTTSRTLQDAKQDLNANTVLVSHGVDYGHFRAARDTALAEPADLAGIGRPRLGFFGLIRDWVDLDLLADVARRRPAWHIVLLGDSTVDLAPYRAIKNMHFLGRKPYEALPAYCRHWDVGLVPFRINDLTLAVNPIKLWEYLAAGLPVVSTALPEVVAQGDRVHVAGTAEETVAAIEHALATTDDRREALSCAMAQETWDWKLARIEEALLGAAAPDD